jgi:predicted DCC family thiol-disulfide oxidoreductase YuxK
MRAAADSPARGLTSEAASCKPLAVMRIIVGAVLLVQAHLLWTYRSILLDPFGPMPWAISDAWVDPLAPKLSHLLPVFASVGLGPGAVVATVLGMHALAAAFMTIGYRTRLSVVVAWATFLLIRNSSMAFTYGLGAMLLIVLFYSLFMPVAREWSVDRVLAPPARREEPADPSLSVAVLRVHLCIVYAASGFAKVIGDQWWSGDALWRALSLPQFQQFDPTPLLGWAVLFPALSIMAAFSQVGYPVLVWTRLRVPIVLIAELLHIGIAIFLGLWLFSLVMIALNTAAFGEAVWKVLAAHRLHAAPPTSFRRHEHVRVIYDGACPFCDDYARYQRLRDATRLELVDARAHPEVLLEHAIAPGSLEDGMVVVADGRLYHGADAMHLLSTIATAPGRPWVQAIALVTRSPVLARVIYPALRLGRRIALAFLGVPRFPRS